MLITRVLNKLLQDVQQSKKSYYTQVERACTSALQDIRSVDTEGDNDHKVLRQKSAEYEQADADEAHDTAANLDLLVGEEARPQISVDSEKFFIPFELACGGDVPKITESALDGIQKLIAYGEIVGDYPDPKSPTRRLIDRIVETICSCHLKLEADEGVELQIIKALLTIVTSEQVQVHESTLLLIMRTCCIIHLTTKSAVNRRTARAMLTQMLHSIFHRMEIAAEELDLQFKNGKAGKNAAFGSGSKRDAATLKDWEAESEALVRQSFSDSILSVSSLIKRKPQDSSFTTNTLAETPTTADTPQKDINQNSENYPEKIQNEAEQNSEMREAGGENSTEEKNSNLENSAMHEQTNQGVNSLENKDDANFPYSYDGSMVSSLQKDAFLTFWTLTKLALKPLSIGESDSENDKHASEMKFQQAILALHLLKEILEKSGKVFKDSTIFVNAMKQHLFHALLENNISTNGDVFKLESEILMIIMTKFIEIVTNEILDLLNALIYPVLEDAASYPPSYTKVVLMSLKAISSNLNCFVHLHTSFDKEEGPNSSKPFQKIVSCMCQIIYDQTGNEEIAVEIITNLLKSMSAACPKLEHEGDHSGTAIESERMRRFSSFEEPLKFDDDLVQNLELEGKDFLTCLHIFLASMDIPCDVFKIDWSVQKLAQKMTDTSSVNSFRTETADCWYALIYASMSLIADIRITNCQGKSKMSKNQFIKLNRAINDCEPLDEAFLSSVYDEIEENYKRDKRTPSSDSTRWFGTVNEKEILATIKYILESTSLLRSHFSLGKQLKHVKRMIKICGPSFLTALISALQNTIDTKLSDVCLDGIHSGIRVACILGLDNEREAYVQALAKLSIAALDEIRGKHINSKIVTKKTSTLTMTENCVTKTVVTTTTEMKCRSVDIILTLLDVGVAEGNHLGGSWLHILKFISQLLSTPLLAESRNSSRSSSPVPPLPGSNGANSGWAAWAGSLKESLEKKLWDPAVTALHPSVKESIATSVEKVFKRSEMLTGDAMTNFFQALCQVSLHDIMNSETPKHLMYEKINEVADGNFYRPALQWSQIWQVVADYFCHLACSSKEEISTLAIDSIQRLVLKLLKKETLNGYRFQNHYFSPFKVIITNTRSQSTRQAVLGFVETVISLHGDLLLSGWIAVLSILVANMLNNDDDKDAAADSFRVLQHIVDKCQKGEVNLRNSFGSIVKSLIDIAGNIAPSLEMSEQAFRLLTQLAEIPYRQPELLMEENDDKRYRVWARGWKPILSQLSAIIINSPNDGDDAANNRNKSFSWDIKTKALITLFEVIKCYGGSFEKEWWNSVFEVLFNIFSDIKSHEKQDLMLMGIFDGSVTVVVGGQVQELMCSVLKFAIFDVYIQYFDATGSYAFDELLKHLQWCICQDHEQIALSGVSCLQQLVVTLGRRFSGSQWDSILKVFETICKPSSQLSKDNNLEYQKVRNCEIHQTPTVRAIIHLELLKIMDRVIFPGRKASIASPDEIEQPICAIHCGADAVNPLLSNNQISLILQILDRSHEIAKENCIMGSRKHSEQSNESIPDSTILTSEANFIPHETLSLQVYWKVLFAMFKTDSPLTKHGIGKEALWQMIQQSCLRSCGYFVTIQSQEHRNAWADLLCFSLSQILKLPKPNFEEMTNELYPYFCEMMEVEVLDGRICGKLREYLLVVGKHYGVALCEVQVMRTSDNSALSCESTFDSVPKTCNSGASIQFQRTCITESLNETYVNPSKDFQ